MKKIMKDQNELNEEVKTVKNDPINEEMDRRAFLQKTTKFVGAAALGATLVNSIPSLPASAASSAASSSSNYVSAKTQKIDEQNQGDQELSEQFQQLTRDTKWQQKENIDLKFNAHHTQGMIKIRDLYYLSSVEIIEKTTMYPKPQNGYDRTPGKGIGHLFVFNKQGELVKDIRLGEGIIYHPGGMDFDGENIWVPVSEYRPNSNTIVYKVDPNTLEAEEAFRVNDCIGGVVRNGKNGKLIGNSWGSRKFYEWNEKGKQYLVKANSSFFVDYQDGHYVGQGKMIASGVAKLPNPTSSDAKPYELGGLALIDMKTLSTLHEVPITQFSPQGRVITRNPVFLETTGEQIRLYAVPDDDEASSLLIYETTNLTKK